MKELLVVMMSIMAMLTGCATQQVAIKPVANVNMQRFMGDWFVIGVIPTSIETEAFNPVENYHLNQDGSINTTFTYNKGSLTGPKKTYRPVGFVREGTHNAIWGMQFIWPIKAEYIIAYLDENYTQTIIARNARDYVWIMARNPHPTVEEYRKLKKQVSDMGYDVSKLIQPQHDSK